jgi:hypothetical protein
VGTVSILDVAAIGGDFFGMHDNNMYHFPFNISTVVDLLEDKHVSWATYQENMPADEFYGFKCVCLSLPAILPPSSSFVIVDARI